METGHSERDIKRAKDLPDGERRIEGAGCAAQAMEAKREPEWRDLGIEQKVERLREATLIASGISERASRFATEAIRIAKEHDHGSGGQVVVPIEGNNRALRAFDDSESAFRRVQRMLG